MMTLRQARCAFTLALAHLVLYAEELGFEMAFAEGMDRITVKDPTSDHMKGSNHDIGLAQDADLYRDGAYLTKTEDHEPLGIWWEQYGKDHGLPLVWGGRFLKADGTPKPDGNHYSMKWQGKS